MKRRWWRILTLMQAVFLTGMPVQAAAADRMLQVQIYAGDYCYVESSGASTIRGAQMAGLCEIDSVYKDVGNLAYLNLGVGTFRNGLYGLCYQRGTTRRSSLFMSAVRPGSGGTWRRLCRRERPGGLPLPSAQTGLRTTRSMTVRLSVIRKG